MEDFDALKNIWQQSENTGEAIQQITLNNTTTLKMKLQRSQLRDVIALSLLAVFITCLAIFGNLNFKHCYTYGGMALMSFIFIVQAGFMYSIYKKLKTIDDTAAPAEHLLQWESYYKIRKKQNKWNMPVFYIMLNIAMAIYLTEVFTGKALVTVTVFIAVYGAWMLYAYFYLDKKKIKREDNRLQKIINELNTIEGQLSKPE